MSHITVRFHAGARDAAGCSVTQVEIDADETVDQLKTRLIQQFPALARFERTLLFAIHEDYVSADQRLHNGDLVSCFPPVSGG